MKKYHNHIFILITGMLLILTGIVLSSCGKTEDPAPVRDVSEKIKRTILVYAVAANNLSSNLDSDMREMLSGMMKVDTSKFRLLVCKVQYDRQTASPTPQELLEVKKNSDGTYWETVKTYSSERRSVDKERIEEVINDVKLLAPSENYGLVFWSHSDAWTPSANYEAPVLKSFGQERDKSKSYYCEVNDLASAVPDNFAEFVWFDSCYMANIETAYEFRNKCKWFIGSTIELDAYGMNYSITLPILLSEAGTVTDAAQVSFENIKLSNCPVAMSVFDMSKIDIVKEAAIAATANFKPLTSPATLQRYSRGITPVIYDFEDYIKALSLQNGSDSSLMKEALQKFVIYKATTPYGWGNMAIDENRYSGVSCHAFTDSESKGDIYYRSLAWYRDVYLSSSK